MDTSGSMKDEAAALCSGIGQVVNALEGQGVTLSATVLGITETPGGIFSCLSGNVVTLLGGTVPGGPTSCVFPGATSAFESWGPATAIVAQRFPWTAGATRMIIPISDEGPCNGSRPDGCNDPGDDRESIANAIAVAGQNAVIVSPITGTGSDGCVTTLAGDLAAGTGGRTFQTQDPGMDLVDAIVDLILEHCDTDDSCDDGRFCTVADTCTNGVCNGRPRDCSFLDDVCLVGVCNEQTNACAQQLADEGTPCDDGDECTGDDVCDVQGNCHGTSSMCPELCLKVVPNGLPCYGVGENVVVNITLTPGLDSPIIVGGQFFFRYPAALLNVINVSPGRAVDPTSPFTFEFFEEVDRVRGSVFYAVGVDPFGGQGTRGPAVMATVRFRALSPCTTIGPLCLSSENPRNTVLVDVGGHAVAYTSQCCSDEIRIRGDEPVISCPESVSVNADAGRVSALVTWGPLRAVADCESTPSLACTATNSFGANINHLIERGGRFPRGLSLIECVAADTCGQTDSCSWSVNVEPVNTVELTVQLSPPIAAAPIRRCIVLEFFSDCVAPPIVVEETLDFGPPFNFPGNAKDVLTKVPAGQYGCVTARDPLHTLRSVAALKIVGSRYMATFKGDPFFGGNWLVGGNLNGDHVIDVLDFGTYLSQYGKSASPDTPCGTPGPHADINGDGTVNENDGWFVQHYLGEQDKDSCCPGGAAAAADPPITEISIEELELMGLGDLSAADLNGDGLLNQEDVDLFLQGVAPNASAQQTD
jgi:hypothetical protein